MVNRVWRWHCGRAWSADRQLRPVRRAARHPTRCSIGWRRRFIEGGWSVKALHRLILLSNTYQMSSAQDPAAVHGRIRKIACTGGPTAAAPEAEAVRDAPPGRSATGLDLTDGRHRCCTSCLPGVCSSVYPELHLQTRYDCLSRRGLPTGDPQRIFMTVLQLSISARLDRAHRRAVPRRRSPPQALFLMNGELVTPARAAPDLAASYAARTRLLYVTAYGRGRPPSRPPKPATCSFRSSGP